MNLGNVFLAILCFCIGIVLIIEGTYIFKKDIPKQYTYQDIRRVVLLTILSGILSLLFGLVAILNI